MIGYAGTGYKGMQINATEKTIEGDIFTALVAAGAISKANADDPKKSSLVRCARTDKGVHAAGNVISLKLIVEDPNTVRNINEHLPPQIRVWGIERTNGAFSCYQSCDSRWYEYLIPTSSFLPPNPETFLAKKLVESAEKEGLMESYKSRQEDVGGFWENAEKEFVQPILEALDPELRKEVVAAFHSSEEDLKEKLAGKIAVEPTELVPTKKLSEGDAAEDKIEQPTSDEILTETTSIDDVSLVPGPKPGRPEPTPLEKAIKDVKAAYIRAKKAYRISPVRAARVQEALSAYIGTCNFHNYTIQKTYNDPSAKRHIRSFKVGEKPIIINDTEWLSLKVHGQSFMMHQIRKMVAMVALVVRCGTDIKLIQQSYGPDNISIPKAPGLGLLLERPVFDSYNERAVREFSRETIDFGKYETEMEEFKQREIYERIFREEEEGQQYDYPSAAILAGVLILTDSTPSSTILTTSRPTISSGSRQRASPRRDNRLRRRKRSRPKKASIRMTRAAWERRRAEDFGIGYMQHADRQFSASMIIITTRISGHLVARRSRPGYCLPTVVCFTVAWRAPFPSEHGSGVCSDNGAYYLGTICRPACTIKIT